MRNINELRLAIKFIFMKFEIPFNKNIYDEQMKLHFETVWSKGFNKNKSSLYITIPILLLGIFAVYNGDTIGYLFVIFGLFSLHKYLEYYLNYKKNKKRFFAEAQTFSNESVEKQDISLLEFENDYFRFKYCKGDFKLDWSLFTGFQIINDTIFIKTKNINYVYIIGKSEIGESAFDEVVEFLKTKMEETPS